MKRGIKLILTAAAVLLPLMAWPATSTDAPAPSEPMALAIDSEVKLSPPARDVAKMAAAGVPADVISAFIGTSTSTFNLTAEGIIHLQKIGVPGTVITAILNHDSALQSQANVPPAIPPQTPAVEPPTAEPAPASPEAQPDNNDYAAGPPTDAGYYNDLAPYGSWNWADGYGWGWQPYAWVTDYPWDFLGFGNWCYRPHAGWCWFPGANLRATDRFHGRSSFAGRGRVFTGQNRFQSRSSFRGNPSVSGQNHFSNFGRPAGTVHVTTIGQHSFGTRTYSTGGMRSSGGGARIGGGGMRSSGGGGMRSGSGGFHR